MINFLRRIRKRLLSDNNFSQYFMFAFVEFILIIIGILIALQVNNWTENRKLISDENEIIALLKEELILNIELMEFRLDENRMFLSAIDDFLDYSESALKSLDVIKKTLQYYPASINSPHLDNYLVNDNKTITITSDLLNSLFLLKVEYNFISKTEFYLDELWNSQVTAFLIKNELGVSFYMEEELPETEMEELLVLSYNKGFKSLVYAKRNLQQQWFNRQEAALAASRDVLVKLNEHEASQ